MICISLDSIPVCCLNPRKVEMSISRVNRNHNEVLVKKSPLIQKKNVRQPLKCKKNTIDVDRSIKKNKFAKICAQQIHSTHKSPISVEIDISREISKTVPPKSPKRILRSSLQKILDPNQITLAEKVSPKYKSKKRQNILDKEGCESPLSIEINVSSEIAKAVPSKSPKRILRSSLQKMTLDSNEIAVAEEVSHKYKRKKQQNSLDKNGCESLLSIEIDALSEIAKTVPSKSPKRILRSSLQKMTMDSNEIAVPDKVSPKYKRKIQQNILDEKTPVSKILPKSPNKNKTSSFYTKNLIAQCNIKSLEKNESCASHNISIGGRELSQTSPNKTVRSTRLSMAFQSSQKFSEHVPLSVTSISKRLKNSEVKTRKCKVKDNKKQIMKNSKRSNKNLSFTPNQKMTPTVKRKYVRKSPRKLKTPVRSQSFSGIPIDELRISPRFNRKAKSEGFKLPCKNSLKRKRFIIDTLKRADEDYEDDIYEEKEFSAFKKMFPDTSESEISSFSSTTPKLGFTLTPLVRAKTPVYKDCLSPTEYAISRKVAEECLYRKNKKRSKPSKEAPVVPEKKKLEFNEVLEEACKIRKEVEKLSVDESSSSDDIYFSDCEN